MRFSEMVPGIILKKISNDEYYNTSNLYEQKDEVTCTIISILKYGKELSPKYLVKFHETNRKKIVTPTHESAWGWEAVNKEKL